MRSVILVVFCLFTAAAFGQSQVDTLSLWNYELQQHAKPQKDKAIGQITFWRAKPIHDSVHLALHQELWTPQISFSIYTLADSAYCSAQSRRSKMSASCIGPDVGGDLYRVGNLILLNRDICLSCVSFETKKDYCRPVIAQVLNAMDPRNVKTLADLESQMGLRKGDAKTLNR